MQDNSKSLRLCCAVCGEDHGTGDHNTIIEGTTDREPTLPPKGIRGWLACRRGEHFPAWIIRGDIPYGFMGSVGHSRIGGCGRCGKTLSHVPRDVMDAAPKVDIMERGMSDFLSTPRGRAHVAGMIERARR